MRDLFLLRDDVIFLNHGSYGACPRPVFEEYQRRLLEEFGIEVVATRWQAHPLLRVSVQAYNTPTDINRLAAAVEAVLR